MPKQFSRSDRHYMMRAIALARRALGETKPNPAVGALVVNQQQIVGYGWHQCAGGAHAEVAALAQAGEQARGGTLYVTLEPCNHHGKTPPCSEAIIESGIVRVVVAARDPNPNVKGQGVRRLVEAGIRVEVGECVAEAMELIAVWSHWVSTSRPMVACCLASDISGRLVDRERSLRSTPEQRLCRRLSQALDCRLIDLDTAKSILAEKAISEKSLAKKLSAIVDPQLEFGDYPLLVPLLGSNAENSVVVFVGAKAEFSRRAALEALGVSVVVLDDGYGGVDIAELLTYLGLQKGVQGVLVDTSASFSSRVIALGLCQRLWLFRGHQLATTGVQLVPALEGNAGSRVSDDSLLPQFQLRLAQRAGQDALLLYDVVYTERKMKCFSI